MKKKGGEKTKKINPEAFPSSFSIVVETEPVYLREGGVVIGLLKDIIDQRGEILAHINDSLISVPVELTGEFRELKGKKIVLSMVDRKIHVGLSSL